MMHLVPRRGACTRSACRARPHSVYFLLYLLLFLTAVGCTAATRSRPMFATNSASLSVGETFEFDPSISEASRGMAVALDAGKPATVVCFLANDCDATSRTMKRIAEFHRRQRDMAFHAVLVADEGELESFVRLHDVQYSIASDAEHTLVRLLGADRTPMFFVFDQHRKLVYRGPFDDSALVPAQVTERWVESAVNAARRHSAPPASRAAVGRPILGSS